jgi:hypothetical protein
MCSIVPDITNHHLEVGVLREQTSLQSQVHGSIWYAVEQHNKVKHSQTMTIQSKHTRITMSQTMLVCNY